MPRMSPLLLLFLLSSACEPTGPDPAPPPEREAAAPPVIVPTGSGEGSLRQVLYVPAYSRIHTRDPERTTELAVTLSVRNTDPEFPITIRSVRYYDNDGALLRTYVREPVPLGPMASRAYVVEQRDASGGVGANFVVEWTAERNVTEPLVEAVMISTASAQGISFTSRAVPLSRP